MQNRWGYLAVGVVLGWATFLLLNDLGVAPLQLYDEGTYAHVVAESLARGDFMTFSLGGTPWFEKPPLYFWLAGVATWVTGDAALGIRLPAALASVVVVALTMLLAYRASGSVWPAVLAGALLILTPPFIQGAREARLDVLVAAGILLAALAFMRRQYVLFGVAVGLAILAKSVIAVFALVFVGIYALCLRDFGWLYDKKFWLGAALAWAIAAPWHLYETALYGAAFWRSYIGTHVLERYEVNLFGDPRLQTDYTAHLFWFAPLLTGLCLLAVITLPLIYRRLHLAERAVVLGLLGTAVAMLLVFYTAQTRAFSYLLPVYPLAAAYIAISVGFISRSVR